MNYLQFETWLHTFKQSSQTKIQSFKTLTMGIVNSTPDSFSENSNSAYQKAAFEKALRFIEEGADIIDIGGESSRPGAKPVSIEEELRRVIPLIQHLRDVSDICISIDTYKAEVMQEAIAHGANIINDIKALQGKDTLKVAAEHKVPVCLMHMQGDPQTMQKHPNYPNGLLKELKSFFKERIRLCLEAGIASDKIIIDPGFGFGKTLENNLTLIKHLQKLKHLNCPLLLGVSNKNTIGEILNKKVNERMVGSLALAVYASIKGVNIIRVHDVNETVQALKIINQVCEAND